MRIASLVLLILLSLHLPAAADVIALHRGMATDIWQNWPNDQSLKDEPRLTDIFPEWRQTLGKVQLARLRTAGFDFVRLTIDPFAYLSNPSPERSAKLNAGVLAAINLIRAEDLNVLVDVHAVPKGGDRQHGTETYLASEQSFNDYVAVAAQLAGALKAQDPAHIAFEPFNEPTLDCPYESEGASPRWPDMAMQLHKAVRQAAPNLTIVLSGACWGGAEGLSAMNPEQFHDDNVIWSFHSYEPFAFSHQGAQWTNGPEAYIAGLHFPTQPKQKAQIIAQTLKRISKSDADEKTKSRLLAEARAELSDYFEPGAALKKHQKPFQIVDTWAKKYAVPAQRILFGEFGANFTDETRKLLFKDRLAFAELSRKSSEAHGWAWSYWDWSGSMAPTDNDQSRNILPEYIRALGLKH
jgi:endoglucanase